MFGGFIKLLPFDKSSKIISANLHADREDINIQGNSDCYSLIREMVFKCIAFFYLGHLGSQRRKNACD